MLHKCGQLVLDMSIFAFGRARKRFPFHQIVSEHGVMHFTFILTHVGVITRDHDGQDPVSLVASDTSAVLLHLGNNMHRFSLLAIRNTSIHFLFQLELEHLHILSALGVVAHDAAHGSFARREHRLVKDGLNNARCGF